MREDFGEGAESRAAEDAEKFRRIFMTGTEALERMRREELTGWHPGLERVRELMEGLGNPQDKLRYVHITGTNGKGSTAAMTARILTAAGYRTGLYTSPHLWTIHERFQVDGRMITDEDFADALGRVLDVNRTLEQPGTEFELLTAAAFVYFAEKKCNLVVLEVGMGGLLDATNVIPAPEAAVITNIGLEHTQYLGATLGAIAEQKSGIIKRGCSAVLYAQSEEVERVVREACAREDAALTVTSPGTLEVISSGLDGQEFRYRGAGPYRIALPGKYQLSNAMTALETVAALRRRGWEIPERAVQEGLRETVWPGRLEVVRRNPDVIVDGAHNPQCMAALSASLSELKPGGKYTFVLGVLGDKDYPAMMGELIPLARNFLVVPVDNPRALPAADLASYLERQGVKAELCGTVEEGVRRALSSVKPEDAVCICGSLYMIGGARRLFTEA